ncbi:hypothetical protein BC831DRAFT_481442 [Entophlyctis helioformis]|nr:hypothetical protein BC831DRAFT_481442 [Entophlyctis helioformis]
MLPSASSMLQPHSSSSSSQDRENQGRDSSSQEFILYLEVRPQSLLRRTLDAYFATTRTLPPPARPTEAHLYHPHVSLTGFFVLPQHEHRREQAQQQQQQLKQAASSMDPPVCAALPVVAGMPIVSQDGAVVLLPISQTEEILAWVRSLAARIAHATAADIRIKRADHLSLAYNGHRTRINQLTRDDCQVYHAAATAMLQQAFHRTAADPPDQRLPAEWDVVLYRRSHVGHVGTAAGDPTEVHGFEEVYRWMLDADGTAINESAE